MNILILSKSLHRGGIETHILTLSEKLQSNGQRVYVASDILKEKDRFKRIRVPVYLIRFSSKNPFIVIKNMRKLNRIIVEKKIDVVHCQWRICSFYMHFYNLFSKKKIPFVWSNHVLLKPSFIKSKITYYGHKTIVSSKDCYESMVNDYKLPKQDVELVYNGINFDDYRYDDSEIAILKNKLNIKDEYVITMLCRFEPIKNHKCMLEALNILVNERHIDNVKCVIVGRGSKEYENDIKELVDKYRLNDVVIFPGYTESISTLGLTNLMVLPSKAEGFPISVIEAFAMKVPVIRTKTGGYTDVKDYCLDMKFDDYVELSKKIEEVMVGGEKINEMCDKAYEFVKKTCTSDVMLNKLKNIYIDAMENDKEAINGK